MELAQNQSAIILEESDDGEITVNIASPEINGLTGSLCRAIASKIMEDEAFQEELMKMLDNDEEE